MTVRFGACQEYGPASLIDGGERDVSATLLPTERTLPDDEEHVIISVDALRVLDTVDSTHRLS